MGVLGILHDVLGFITDASAFAAVTIAPLKLVSSFVFVCPVISGILAESECIPDWISFAQSRSWGSENLLLPCFSFSSLNILCCSSSLASRFERGTSSLSLWSFFFLRGGLIFHHTTGWHSFSTIYTWCITSTSFILIIYLLERLDCPSKYPTWNSKWDGTLSGKLSIHFSCLGDSKRLYCWCHVSTTKSLVLFGLVDYLHFIWILPITASARNTARWRTTGLQNNNKGHALEY